MELRHDVSASHCNLNLLHVAAYYGCGQELEGLLNLQTYIKLVNEYTMLTTTHRTPLHFAIDPGGPDAVAALLKEQTLNLAKKWKESRDFGPTLIDQVVIKFGAQMDSLGLEKQLLVRIQENTKRLMVDPASSEASYRDRQVYVDAANAILVGAALIASVTFAGFLQPPLGYVTYYTEFFAYPAPPSTPESFAAVGQYRSVRLFWVFNSLSFFFAIATVLAGAGTVLPAKGIKGTIPMAMEVQIVRQWLKFTSVLLAVSIVFVLGAFTAAGSASLPNIAQYQFSIVSTAAIGLGVCLVTLCAFSYRLILNLMPMNPIYLVGVVVTLEASAALYFLCKPLLHRIANG